jgi:hypothetical protein
MQTVLIEQECVICIISTTKFITFDVNIHAVESVSARLINVMCRAPINRIKPMKVILVFPGNIITPFYFDPCDHYNNGRLTNMSNKLLLRFVPNLWKYEFESIILEAVRNMMMNSWNTN